MVGGNFDNFSAKFRDDKVSCIFVTGLWYKTKTWMVHCLVRSPLPTWGSRQGTVSNTGERTGCTRTTESSWGTWENTWGTSESRKDLSDILDSEDLSVSEKG